MGKLIETVYKDERITLTKQMDGFWLWDEALQMNGAVKAPTERQAFIDALRFYQTSYPKTKQELYALQDKVQAFVEQVTPENGWE